MSPNELKNTLSKNIKTFRKRLGLTQFALAEKSNLSEDTVKSIELTRQWPSEKTLVQIADALETNVFELFLPEAKNLAYETEKTTELKNLIAQNIREYVNIVLENI